MTKNQNNHPKMDCDDVVFVKEQIFVKYKEPVFIDLTGDDLQGNVTSKTKKTIPSQTSNCKTSKIIFLT